MNTFKNNIIMFHDSNKILFTSKVLSCLNLILMLNALIHTLNEVNESISQVVQFKLCFRAIYINKTFKKIYSL